MMKRYFVWMLALCMLIAGCGSTASDIPEGAFILYYENVSSTRLVRDYYIPVSDNTTTQAMELFAKLRETGPDDCHSAVPESVDLAAVELTGGILRMYLIGSLDDVRTNARLLFFAALTRTMTQCEGVSGIYCYLNNSPATDSGGKILGVLRTSTFVNNAVDNPDDYRDIELELYFSNEKMDKLVKTTRLVSYSSSATLERIVVEQILAGPELGEAYPSVSPTVTLLGINVRDGICYVNFDDKFISDMLGGYDAVPVYSIVDSLCQLDGIEQVQISINGSSDETSSTGQISFAAPLSFNMDIIE